MDTKRYYKNVFLWMVPAVLLLITLLPVALPAVYSLILQVVVTIAAILIAYLLLTEKPKYYIVWGIIFILIVLIYNPLVHVNVTWGVVPINLITAIIFILNWWFVYRK